MTNPTNIKALADEAKRLAEDMADKACATEAGEFVARERRALHAAIDALAAQAGGAGKAVAWGCYAKLAGKWELQYPVYSTKGDAELSAERYVEDVIIDVRPLYAAAPTSDASAEPATPSAREVAMEKALRGLHDDDMDYIRLNKLGAENNHWLVAARAALAMPATEAAGGRGREPLSEERIYQLEMESQVPYSIEVPIEGDWLERTETKHMSASSPVRFARAIEAAHGIRATEAAGEPLVHSFVDGWYLSTDALNEPMRAGIAALVAHAKRARWTNATVRKDGKETTYEADWIKSLVPFGSAQADAAIENAKG